MTNEEFKQIAANGVSLVKFSAQWCFPCKMLDKTLDVVQYKHPEINVVHVDVEESPELAEEFQISNVPVMFFFVDGEMKERIVGNVPEKKIESVLETLQN
ncbi:MAG: thioredoxin family protein [Bacteroidales bacterium]|nr:thioredoxin family protein [Bacteroidales bacterium]